MSMSRRAWYVSIAVRVVALAAALGVAAAPAAAREILKMATLAPQGSIWDTTLREMGAAWSKQTAGAVELRVYPGGVAGDESDVVRKMRIGQFQGAALTVTGLAELDPAFGVFQIPLFFESWEEVNAVLERLGPDLERRLEAKGYVLVLWGHGGWVHLFSRQPVRTLDDLKKQKLFVWAGDDGLVQLWRRNGYQPVALAATDVTMGFQTGMIDVVPTTPIAALSLQWFRQTAVHDGPRHRAAARRDRDHEEGLGRLSAADRDEAARRRSHDAEGPAAEIPKQDAQAVTQWRTGSLA